MLSRDLRFGSGEDGLEVADGGSGVGFDGMVGHRVEERAGPRMEDGSGGCCTCV